MAEVIDIKIMGMRNVNTLFGNLERLPVNFSKTLKRFTRIARDSIREQFIVQRKRAARKPTAMLFKSEMLSKFRHVIKIPLSAAHLDSMTPHHVSLKRGRAITKWSRKYYSRNSVFQKGRKSRVIIGPRGGIKGSLFVSPDPFIERGYNKVANRLPIMLNRTLHRTIRQGG